MWKVFCFAFLVGFSSAAVSPVSLDAPAVNRSLVTEVSSNNVTSGRSLFGPLPPFLQTIREVTLPIVVKELGLIECEGLDHTFGGDFFKRIMDPYDKAKEQNVDFSGNYLCQPTCQGKCVPTRALGQAPISIYYPFGCRCPAHRCGVNGPNITSLVQPLFKVKCVRDERCTCGSMYERYEPKNSLVGYLCNWININSDLPITFLDRPAGGYNPTYSPIRWCSCCPAHAVGLY